MHVAQVPEEPCAFRNPEASLSFLMIWRGTTGAAGDSAACSLHLRLRGGGPVIGSSTDAGGGPCSMLPLVFEPRENRVGRQWAWYQGLARRSRRSQRKQRKARAERAKRLAAGPGADVPVRRVPRGAVAAHRWIGGSGVPYRPPYVVYMGPK